MINQNLKTQVQNRIDAATGATSIDDLLLIRKSAAGLGCNEANLDAQIAARLTALGVGATAIELVGGNASLGLNGRIMYQTPIAVESGDQLYIDALGVVKKEKHPLSVAIAATFASVNGVSPLNMLRGVSGLFIPGDVSSAGAMFDFALSDGNRMIGINHRQTADNYGVQIYVTTPDRLTILWSGFIAMQVAGFVAFYIRTIGLFEVSANTFRLFYAVPEDAGAAWRNILFHSLAYNTSTKAVTGATGSTVFTGTVGHSFVAQSAQRQGERYRALCSGVQTVCLDMQGSTVTNYTGLPGGNATAFDHSDPANVFARVVSGSTIKLIQAGGTTNIDLPTNLTSDGCFGAAWQPTLIGPGMYITRHSTTGQIKLVKFNSTYTTATIYSLGTSSIVNNATNQLFVSDGSRFWIRFNQHSPTIHFTWTGSSAPTGIDLNCGETSLHRAPKITTESAVSRVIGAADKIIAFSAPYAGYPVSVLTQSAVIMSFDAAETLPYSCTYLGTAVTAGSASSFIELQLADGLRYEHRSVGVKHNSRQHNGVLVEFGFVPVPTGQSTTVNAATPIARLDTTGAVIAGFEACELRVTVDNYDTGQAGRWSALTYHGIFTGDSALDIACHKPFVAAFVGQSNVRKEVLL
jgi:hypothetical protein